jgi:hypothetical protein
VESHLFFFQNLFKKEKGIKKEKRDGTPNTRMWRDNSYQGVRASMWSLISFLFFFPFLFFKF